MPTIHNLRRAKIVCDQNIKELKEVFDTFTRQRTFVNPTDLTRLRENVRSMDHEKVLKTVRNTIRVMQAAEKLLQEERKRKRVMDEVRLLYQHLSMY
jgi:2-keto-3-deoxy-L-rhamnonate aldolase RhmA